MPRLAANLSLLFTEQPFLERFAHAAKAGFEAVELQFPYDWPAAAIRQRLDDHGLELVLHNLPAGDAAAGDRGIACDPSRSAEFRAGVARAIDYAQALGAPRLNCLAGRAPAGIDEGRLRDALLDNLAWAAAALKAAGLRLLIEPINRFDVPGFYLHRIAQAAEVLEALAADNAFIQFDLYHAERSGEALEQALAVHLPRIDHVQIADHPGRHEPGTGGMPYAFLLAELDRLGYAGWVGCEYHPATTTEAGLGWRDRLLAP